MGWLQVLKPLLPKKPEKGEKENLPSPLRSWQEAEKQLCDDPRFGRAPPGQRSLPFSQARVACTPVLTIPHT